MLRALTLALLTLLLAAPAASAQDPVVPPAPEEPRIRAGVMVSGVDVGNLTLAEAQLRLEQAFAPAFAQGVTVTAVGQSATLPMASIDFVFHADETALRALKAGQKAPAAPDGTLPPAVAKPAVSYDRKAVRRFVRRLRDRVGIEARDATIKIRLKRISRRRHHRGRRLAVPALMTTIKATLKDPLAVRQITAGVETVVPAVRKADLRRVYRRVITIDRSGFRLRLFKKLRYLKGYGVAVGMPAYPTPTGLFAIQTKQVNPTWTAPDSPWAGEMAGQSVAGGAVDNPLKARWMGVDGSVGIHGTGQPWTIGTRASHGCIRMSVPDVIDLFRRVSIGTPVLIK
jgi:lipoprotein-anchoring transpeptidase ErfK/SrfK